MARKFQTGVSTALLLLAFVVAPQVASAANYTFEAGAGQTVFLTAGKAGEHNFSTPNFTVSCATVGMSGTTVAPSSGDLTLAPSYSGCTGFVGMHYQMNGCTYTFKEPASVGGSFTVASPEIVCPAGKEIEVTLTTAGVSACTQKFPPQVPTGGHVIFNNAGGGSPMDLTFQYTENGIHYTGTGGLCGNGETHSNAETTGTFTLRGFSNAGHTTQIGITID